MSFARFLPLATLVALGVGACAPISADLESTDRDSEGLASGSRVFLVPTDEQARTLCRAQIDDYYCDAAGAQAAAAACLSSLPASLDCGPGGADCLRKEKRITACAADAPIYPTRASCKAPVAGNCAFYAACLDQNVPCGEGGYALGYGEKYCTGFANASFSAKGHVWMLSVMGCLQTALVPYTTAQHSNATCGEIEKVAFDSHPACYTKPSASICFLPPWDVLAVLQTIGGKQIFDKKTVAQMKTVIGTCLFQIGGSLFGNAAPGQSYIKAPTATAELEAPPELTTLSPAELGALYDFWHDLGQQYDAER
jgi:hypothetical protein